MTRADATDIARLALALLDTRPGQATMAWAATQAAQPGGLAALAQAVVDGGQLGAAPGAIASALVRHVGLTGASAASAEGLVVDALAAAGPGHEGAAIVDLMQAFAAAEDHPVADIAAAARAFNREAAGSVAYAALAGTQDLSAAASAGRGTVFTDLGGGAVRITGDQDVRIDVTNRGSVVVGIDLDGDGVIELDGCERGAVGGPGWHIIDAYPRNPLDHTDTTNNFTGDLFFDGEGLRGAGAASAPAMLVFGFEPGADRLRLGTALSATLDDRGIDGHLAWAATDNVDSTRQVIDLNRVEALWLASGDARVGSGSLADTAAVAAAVGGAGGVALRNAAGADALLLLAAADAPNVSALYLFRDADGSDAVAAAELTLLGIVSSTGAGIDPGGIMLA